MTWSLDSQVDKSCRLVLEEIDHLNVAILAKVLAELLFGNLLKVGNLANIHVTTGSRLNGLSLSLRERTRVFSPSDLESTGVDREARKVDLSVKGQSGRRIRKSNKLPSATALTPTSETYSNVLVPKMTDLNNGSASNVVAQLLGSGVGMQVSEVDIPVACLGGGIVVVVVVGRREPIAGEQR